MAKGKDLTTNAKGGSGRVYEPTVRTYAADVTPAIDRHAAATRDTPKSTTPTASPGENLNTTPAQQQAKQNAATTTAGSVRQPTQTGSGVPASAVQVGLGAGQAVLGKLANAGMLGKAAQTAAAATTPQGGTQAPAAQPQQPVTPQMPVQGAMQPQTGMYTPAAQGSAQSGYMQPYDPSDIKSFLESYFGTAQKNAEAQINYATQQGVNELQRAQEKTNQQLQEQRNQAAIQGANARDNQALYAEARGDRGGIGAAQYDAVMNNTAQIQASINQQQTTVANDTARQIADLRAKGEYEKADALLELSQQYLSQLMSWQQWALSYNMDVAQFNRQIEQDAQNYAFKVASLTGYYNGMPTLDYQQYLNDQAWKERQWDYNVAADEWDRQYKLQQYQDEQTEQLAKVGMSLLSEYGSLDAVPENARAAMQAYYGDTAVLAAQIRAAQEAEAAQAAARSYSSSGGSRRSSGGGGSSGDGGSSSGAGGNAAMYSDAWWNQIEATAKAEGRTVDAYLHDPTVKKALGLTSNEMLKWAMSQYNEWSNSSANKTGSKVNKGSKRTSLDYSQDEGTFTWNGKRYMTLEGLMRAINAAKLTDEEGSEIVRKLTNFGFDVR